MKHFVSTSLFAFVSFLVTTTAQTAFADTDLLCPHMHRAEHALNASEIMLQKRLVIDPTDTYATQATASIQDALANIKAGMNKRGCENANDDHARQRQVVSLEDATILQCPRRALARDLTSAAFDELKQAAHLYDGDRAQAQIETAQALEDIQQDIQGDKNCQ